MPRQHFGRVHLDDITRLEVMFASLTADGWVLPTWLTYLREQMEQT